jgi:hypothetical protein
LRNENYILSQTGISDKTPAYFDTPPSYTVNYVGENSMSIKRSGYEKKHATVMLAVSAYISNLPPYMILNSKTLSKEQLPSIINVRCQPNGWMTYEFKKDQLSSDVE